MAKFIAQLVVAGTQIIGRAFARALKQEIEASQEAARRLGNTKTRAERVSNNRAGISLDEAKQILNVNELEQAEIAKRYDALFKANDKASGGSFYILSKIVRAKERLDLEMKEAPPSEKSSAEKT